MGWRWRESLLCGFVLATLFPVAAAAFSQSVRIQDIRTDAGREASAGKPGQPLPDRSSETVTVTGILISEPRPAADGISSTTYLEDETSGIQLRAPEEILLTGSFHQGDKVVVSGKVAARKGVEYLAAEEIRPVAHGQTPRALPAQAAELLRGQHLGRLVRLQGRLLVPRGFDPGSSRLPVTLADGSGQIGVITQKRFFANPEFLEKFQKGGRIELVGVAEKCGTSVVANAEYCIKPRMMVDFHFASDPPYKEIAGTSLAVFLLGMIFYLWDRRSRAERNATETGRILEALQEKEKSFRLLFVHNPIPMFVVDRETSIFLEVNESAIKNYGYSRDEFLEMIVPDILLPEDGGRGLKAVQSVGPGVQSQGEWRHRLKDGRIIYVEIISDVLDFLGRKAILASALDITERKRAEEEKARLTSILEATTDFVAIADLSGKLLYMNRSGRKLLGFGENEDLSDKINMDTHPAWAAQLVLNEGIPTALRSGAWHGETVLLSRDGREIPVSQVILSHKSPDGTGQFLSTIMRDITERKRTEEALCQAKEAAEAASRAKSEFLANMSHEIRTPMNAIMGMTDLALDTELTHEQREYLSTVKKSTESLLTVINDILDFSKIEAGKFEFSPVEFSPREAVEEAVKALAMQADEKGLELSCRIAPTVPERLVGDPDRVRQVIMNLAGNAIKFTKRGEVVLEVEEAGGTSEGAELHFSVRDTGIGIPADKLGSVFEAFVQADASTTRQYGGTGLGLAISTRLAELMGGRIWAESEEGKGSTFHFTARFGRSRSAPESAKRPAGTLAGVPVLVVDDNASNRRILEEMLVNWSMEPSMAENGVSAMQQINHACDSGRPYELILLDVHMPGMDGFELAKRIRQTPAFRGATIMMLTSGTHNGDLARCRELGIAAYLTKPIRRNELLDAILKALNREKAQAETHVFPARRRHQNKSASKRILLAEDNPVNRKVALRILEKHGHRVVVASNGREVIAELEKSGWSGFDLVLMDVQMPQMDGFAAAAAIRELEKTSGVHLPIVAMTAHAMKGDRERCLQAGMDGYVSKPFQVQDLLRQVEQLAQEPAAEPGERSAAPPEKDERRRKALIDFFEGDDRLLREVVDLFLRDYPRLLGNVREAAGKGDAPGLERAAHSLKSSVSVFAAPKVFSLLEKMERSAREGELSFGRGVMAELEVKMRSLASLLAELGSERRLAKGA